MRFVDVVESRSGGIISINVEHVIAVLETGEEGVSYKSQIVLTDQRNIFTQETRESVVRTLLTPAEYKMIMGEDDDKPQA